VGGANDGEVAVVHRRDGGDTEAFSDRDDAGVHEIEPEIGVRLDEFRAARPVGCRLRRAERWYRRGAPGSDASGELLRSEISPFSVDVERFGSSGRADADETQPMFRGVALGGEPGGDVRDELVAGDPAARGFGSEARLRVGRKIECHGHRSIAEGGGDRPSEPSTRRWWSALCWPSCSLWVIDPPASQEPERIRCLPQRVRTEAHFRLTDRLIDSRSRIIQIQRPLLAIGPNAELGP